MMRTLTLRSVWHFGIFGIFWKKLYTFPPASPATTHRPCIISPNTPQHPPSTFFSLTSNSIATRSRAESETEAPEHYDDHTISSGGHMDGEYVAAPDAL